MSTVAVLLSTTLAQSLRMSVPYIGAGLGGVWSERSGVVNIALEGMLIAGALGSVVAHVATGSPWAGAAVGALLGALLGAVHAGLVVRGRVDAIVSGLAINLAAAGASRFVLRALYASSSNSPAIAGFRIVTVEGATGLALLARTLGDPLLVSVAGLVAATVWAMDRTRFGLRVRACGEDADAATTAGVPVGRVRVAAVALGGAIAGLGGVALAYDQHQFQSGMTAGRGYIALAAVVLSGWRGGRAAACCVAFAALDALQLVVQDRAGPVGAAAQTLPYVATLAALALVARRGAGAPEAPASLGK